MFVIDCSVVSSWLLPDEHEDIKNGLSSFIIEKNPKIYVPCLFYLEVMNVLEMAHKRKRIDRQTKSDALEALKSLPIVLDSGATDMNFLAVISEYAERYQLTSYDASYLELAIRRNAKLITYDKELIKAANNENVLFVFD